MERSRSKRGYYYDQESDSQASPPPRTKARYHHRRGGDRRPPPPPPPSSSSSGSKFHDGSPSSPSVTTSFRILCPDERAGSVIGKGGCFLKNFRQETGAWITVHELAPGDEELIIETSDNRRREPDGRPPQYSPAQEALILVHERILDAGFELDGDLDEDDYSGWGGGDRDRGRVITRLVVPRGHVGCLMGKGGKIIEQMRVETKTHIRILPRDHHTPRCVSASEEVVQVVGDCNAVKKAVSIISSRLKESFHRERGPYRGRPYSPERYLPAEDEFAHNLLQRPDETDAGHRSARSRESSYPSRSPVYPPEFDSVSNSNRPQQSTYEDIVFQVLCPNDKVESMMGESCGILEMLRDEVGVDVSVSDSVPGSDERVIVITSDEGPNDELFPAQEALLHIQNQMVDLDPDKGKTVTTRLLVPASSAGSLTELRRLGNANIQVLPREEFPSCASGAFELLQIVGEIRAAREALLQITSWLRSFVFRDVPTLRESSTLSQPGPDSGSPKSEVNRGVEQSSGTSQGMKIDAIERKPEEPAACQNGSLDRPPEGQVQEDQQQTTGLPRPSAPSPSQKTLEVSIPEQAVPSLIMRSGHKLAQIGEMSGAKLSLIDARADQPGRVVQISGSPEQAERAQSLLQGFILSTL
ncbi:RNA-binding KH domain-containing protein [Wolffia australiana]